MTINRTWEMPSKWTFEIPSIQRLLSRYSVGNGWIDPFCGQCSPAEFRNDLNPNNLHASHHMEAIDFLNIREWDIKGAIFDPPYSLTQVSRAYEDIGLSFKGEENPTGGFPRVKSRLSDLLKPGQLCISFGWNTSGLGLKNGFQIVEILIVCHGSNRNDTLVTVEQKQTLF